jgi:hypothetical protein
MINLSGSPELWAMFEGVMSCCHFVLSAVKGDFVVNVTSAEKIL